MNINKLPKGYYAVAADFENAPKEIFNYKGVDYAVESGVNLFPSIAEALAAVAPEAPETVIDGLDYESFPCPVILLSAGIHKVGAPSSTKVEIRKNIAILGQKAGVKPNLPSPDPLLPHILNPERSNDADESTLKGDYYFGHIFILDPDVSIFIVDGITCFRDLCFADARRASLNNDCTNIFKNIIHKSPTGNNLYIMSSVNAGIPFKRTAYFDNIRLDKDFFDLGYAGVCFSLCNDKSVLRDVCIDGTTQVFGLTNLNKTQSTGARFGDISEITMENCYFAEFKSENGLSTHVEDWGLEFNLKNTTLLNASRPNEAPLQLELPNEKCSVNIEGCHIVDTRNNITSAIEFLGHKENINIKNTVIEGFASDMSEAKTVDIHDAPDYIESREESWESGTEDSHTVIGTKYADFSELDAYYEGCRAYYGDQHVHTKCGGTSDGQTPMSEWVAKMDELGLDFAIVVDHRQMRGYFLPEWSEERFVMGTEPGSSITNPSGKHCIRSAFHYNMVFPHKYALAMVLANFPEFNFKGDELTGKFGYPNFTKERMYELCAYLRSIGGMLVHAHPKLLMGSDDPLDYYFGEHSYLEVIVSYYSSHASVRSYDTWVEILNQGKHMFASGGSDTHSAVTNVCPSTFYTTERHHTRFVERMYNGDYAVGGVGVKMFIDGHPMGSEIAYKDGMKLTLRVGDFYHATFQENTAYELEIITDKGVAYSSIFNGKLPQEISLEVQKRNYYRVVVKDVNHRYRVCVSNPIWLDKVEEQTAE